MWRYSSSCLQGGNKGCKLGSSKKHLFKCDYKSVGTEMKNSLEKERRNLIERHHGHESFESGSIGSFQLGIRRFTSTKTLPSVSCDVALVFRGKKAVQTAAKNMMVQLRWLPKL